MFAVYFTHEKKKQLICKTTNDLLFATTTTMSDDAAPPPSVDPTIEDDEEGAENVRIGSAALRCSFLIVLAPLTARFPGTVLPKPPKPRVGLKSLSFLHG